MFNRIIDWSVDNSILVVGLLLGIIAGSAMLLPSLNLDAFPDVTNVQVSVNTEALSYRHERSHLFNWLKCA